MQSAETGDKNVTASEGLSFFCDIARPISRSSNSVTLLAETK